MSTWPADLADAGLPGRSQATTLNRVVEALSNSTPTGPASAPSSSARHGSSGFEAATNIIVKQASRDMLYYVYGAVILLCLLTFRSLMGWSAPWCH